MAQPAIVLGVDFSQASRWAADAAARLAADLGARVVLAHALEPLPGRSVASQSYTLLYKEMQAEIDVDAVVELTTEWAERIRADGVDVETKIADEDPVDLLLETAEESRASVIVVGTHGHGLLHRLALGSVAAKVVRRSKVPVLVVPKPH